MYLKMSGKNKMKHVLQYKERYVISGISNHSNISLKSRKHMRLFSFYQLVQMLKIYHHGRIAGG